MLLEFQFVHPLPDWLNRQWKPNSNKNSNKCAPSFVLTTGLHWSILISKLGSGFSIAMTISLVLLANSVVYSDGSISITTWGLSVPLSAVSLGAVITCFLGFGLGFNASVSSSFFLRRATNSASWSISSSKSGWRGTAKTSSSVAVDVANEKESTSTSSNTRQATGNVAPPQAKRKRTEGTHFNQLEIYLNVDL